MKLLIVESPAKAKTIEKYLGSEYKVTASVGHIRDLPKSNKQAIDVENGFVPSYVVSKGKEKIIRDIKSLAKNAKEVILATDPDREGESIAWHIKEACGLENPKRVVFNEITKNAVQAAMSSPRDIDENLRKAQEARRVLDRLFGYDLSELIWRKVRYGLSAGRVQSPALRIIMERERKIRAFSPVTFWVITALFNMQKNEVPFVCTEEPTNFNEAERILSEGEKGSWSISKIKETEAKSSPKPPFTTSTLQQVASTRLGFSPSRTMLVAQRLYEAGFITYIRTDSTTLSNDALSMVHSEIIKKYGDKYKQMRVYKTKSKSAQEAHEAVRPTSISKTTAGTTDEQKKLYELIWQRTVASQMSDAKILRTKITANIKGRVIPDFAVNGSRLLFDGWLMVDTTARGEDVELPKLSVGDSLSLAKIESEEKQTQPPSRYTEAGLIKELEKRGIGRPSTYATTIRNLNTRGYVEKNGRTLFPTDTGEVVSDFVEKYFADYINDSFTAEMENELDDIANGKRKYLKTLKDFYGPFRKDIENKKGIEKLTNLGNADPSLLCPSCKSNMIIKLGKNGKFLSCGKFPECMGARTMDGAEIEGPKETGEDCPKCNGRLILREGRFGKFISCDKYPKCKFIKESEEEVAKRSTGVSCTECAKKSTKENITGVMVERKGRFGVFYSCSNYPDCKLAIKARPTGRKCPLCSALMMQGTKTIPERCSDKGCEMHNPHKINKDK